MNDIPPAASSRFSGRKVTVMGLGLLGGGVQTVKFLVRCGARVTVTDLKDEKALAPSVEQIGGLPVRMVLGRHEEEDFTQADCVVVSPAVPDHSNYLAAARDAGTEVTTEMNIFFQLCPALIFGITGSNGKTTTAHLAFEMLRRSPTPAVLGGNVGRSLVNELGLITPEHAVVLEISSFQLERLRWAARSPHVALITNLTPNHLDRHATMHAYRSAKQAILDYQNEEDFCVLNLEDPELEHWEACAKGEVLRFSTRRDSLSGARLRAGRLELTYRGACMPVCAREEVALPGEFNVSNALGAACGAFCFGARPEQMADALRSFKGVEHRLEFVLERGGVRYYNDSIATTPESTIAALGAFESPVTLVAGGYDKKLSFDALGRVIAAKAANLVLVGATSELIERAVAACGPGPRVIKCGSFEEAVHRAMNLATAPGVVLLSPACASYDMFANFEERGNLFKRLVREAAAGRCGGFPAAAAERRPRERTFAGDLRCVLERAAGAFAHERFVREDPLGEVTGFEAPADREVAAFVAAAFAFGNIKSILSHLREIWRLTGKEIARFAREYRLNPGAAPFAGFRYRWVGGRATGALFHVLGEMLRRCGCIEEFFKAGAGDDLKSSLDSFCRRACGLAPAGLGAKDLRALAYFFPSPAAGGAAKRLNLFLRWMVRTHSPDLGLWTCLAPAQLVVPLDVHVARAARQLGLTRRRTNGWAMACEVTDALRLFDPCDPLRYDFALHKLGVSGGV